AVRSSHHRRADVVVAPDREGLLAASPFERRALVEAYLRAEMARLLKTPLSDEDMEMPVQSLGLDSLMAIQVRNRVEAGLGVSVSVVDFLKGLRVRQLVDNIVAQLAPAAQSEPRPAVYRPPTTDQAGVGALSESEVDSLLATLLNTRQDAGR